MTVSRPMRLRRPRRSPPSHDADASYQALLDAAMRCFGEHGYAATRVEDIVQAAGYTRGAFYFHFADKTDCFTHVIAHRNGLRGDWPARVLDGLDPATTRLHAVLERAFARFATAAVGVPDWVLVMVDYHQQHRRDPDAARLLAETYRGWRGEIASFVRALQRGGWIAADRDSELLASELFAYGEGVIVHASLYGLDRKAALVDGLVRLLRG